MFLTSSSLGMIATLILQAAYDLGITVPASFES